MAAPFQDGVQRHARRAAVVFAGGQWSYEELWARVQGVAARLLAQGLGRGDVAGRDGGIEDEPLPRCLRTAVQVAEMVDVTHDFAKDREGCSSFGREQGPNIVSDRVS